MSELDQNQNQDETEARKKRKGFLSKVFSYVAAAGAGAAVAMAFKTCALTALCTAGAPVAASTIVACAGAGLLVGSLKALWRFHKAKKENPDEKFFTKRNLVNIGIHTAISTATGSLTLFFGDAISEQVANLFDSGEPQTDIVVAQEPETPVMAPTPEPTEDVIPEISNDNVQPEIKAEPEFVPEFVPEISATEEFLNDMAAETADLTVLLGTLDSYITENNITDETVLALVEKAGDGNAQALKDLAAIINTEGKVICIEVPKDSSLVVQLYEAAVGRGNTQAMIDYAYMQNFGHNGIEADGEAAAALMKHVMDNTSETNRLHEIASCFYEQWTEGFNGNDCVGEIVCTVEEIPTETQPEPPVEDVVELEPEPAPEPEADPSDNMNCTAIIDGKDISFLCEVDENTDALLEYGDTVFIRQMMLKPN